MERLTVIFEVAQEAATRHPWGLAAAVFIGGAAAIVQVVVVLSGS